MSYTKLAAGVFAVVAAVTAMSTEVVAASISGYVPDVTLPESFTVSDLASLSPMALATVITVSALFAVVLGLTVLVTIVLLGPKVCPSVMGPPVSTNDSVMLPPSPLPSSARMRMDAVLHIHAPLMDDGGCGSPVSDGSDDGDTSDPDNMSAMDILAEAVEGIVAAVAAAPKSVKRCARRFTAPAAKTRKGPIGTSNSPTAIRAGTPLRHNGKAPTAFNRILTSQSIPPMTGSVVSPCVTPLASPLPGSGSGFGKAAAHPAERCVTDNPMGEPSPLRMSVLKAIPGSQDDCHLPVRRPKVHGIVFDPFTQEARVLNPMTPIVVDVGDAIAAASSRAGSAATVECDSEDAELMALVSASATPNMSSDSRQASVSLVCPPAVVPKARTPTAATAAVSVSASVVEETCAVTAVTPTAAVSMSMSMAMSMVEEPAPIVWNSAELCRSVSPVPYDVSETSTAVSSPAAMTPVKKATPTMVAGLTPSSVSGDSINAPSVSSQQWGFTPASSCSVGASPGMGYVAPSPPSLKMKTAAPGAAPAVTTTTTSTAMNALSAKHAAVALTMADSSSDAMLHGMV